MIYIRLDIVNKKEYEELNKDYKEIKISFPKDAEELKKDFKYLGLDYKNLGLQDTHIKECAVICEEDPDFSVNVTGMLNRLIARADNKGYTTPFNDMKNFYDLINNIQPDDRDKILAILEAEEERINNMKDVLKYVKNLDRYYLDWATHSPEEYASNGIHLGELNMNDVFPYIDLETLGKDLIKDRNARLTEYGVLCIINESIEQENEEEFE